MDPFTHAISGAVLARAIPKQKLPGGAIWFLAIVAMLPDADYVLRLFSNVLYLRYHRGVTHSILLLPLWAWLCYSIIPRQRRKYPVMPWLIAATLCLHIVFDLVTSFGTMILAPLSKMRFTWDLVFIIDPLFTLTLLIPLILTRVWPAHARRLCIIGLAGMTAYLGLAYVNHRHALALARLNQPQAEYVAALPLPFSPFRWQLIAEYPGHYQRAAVDLKPGFPGTGKMLPDKLTQRLSTDLRPIEDIKWQQFPAMKSLTDIDRLPGVSFYRWFARFPVVLRKDSESLEFADLRFFAGPLQDSPFRLMIEMQPEPRVHITHLRTPRR